MSGKDNVSIDLMPRLDLRKKIQRRVLARRIAAAVLFGLLLLGLIWAVFFSAIADARRVKIQGNHLVSAETVEQTAQVPLGTPLARIDADSIEQRLLALPEVADVQVQRRLLHTVEITITERQMVYQLLNDNGYQWVDDQGHLFQTRAEPQPGIVVIAERQDQETLAALAELVTALPESVSTNAQGIEVSSSGLVTITLTDGRLIKWGEPTQIQEKADLLPHLMQVPGTVYDVSVPSHPAVS